MSDLSISIDPTSLDDDGRYKLMTGIVVPRPIAWVTTMSDEGLVNAAPFSAFTFLSYRPIMLCISVAGRGGKMKDTERNIRARGEFVVNMADEAMVRELHLSAGDYPSDVSEVEDLGLQTVACEQVEVPRLADAAMSMECRLDQILPFGEVGHHLIIGTAVRIHVRESLYANGRIDVRKYRAVGRLGGPNYVTAGTILTMTDPQFQAGR